MKILCLIPLKYLCNTFSELNLGSLVTWLKLTLDSCLLTNYKMKNFETCNGNSVHVFYCWKFSPKLDT